MKFTGLLLAALFASHTAFAGMAVLDQNSKLLGFAGKIKCASGATCSLINGDTMNVAVPGTVGQPLISGSNVTFTPFPVSATTGVGTSTAGVATSAFVIQVFVDNNATLTGIAVNNGATVGTNKYIVALFNASGQKLANSALAGTNTAGASAWQKIPFTSTLAVTGPAIYYAAVYMNGTTDNFFTVPAAGEYVGNAGTVTGQTFGTVVNITPPSSFTAGAGPIIHTY